MEEIWKHINGYEDLYEVSSYGNFRKICDSKVRKHLKATKNNYGYYTIGLRKNHKVKQYRVSRLVAEAFIPNPDNKPYVDHIDTDKSNNKITNLRWVTPKENLNNSNTLLNLSKSWNSEERRKRQSENNLGVNHPRATAVCQLDEDGNILKVFSTVIDAARYVKCKHGNISKCCKGERVRAGGYKWKYA